MEKADLDKSDSPITVEAEKLVSTCIDDAATAESAQGQAKARPKRIASFRDYVRVFQYATKWDFVAYAAGVFASIGAGITLPLMNVVFGNFVGSISDFTNAANLGQDGFRKRADKLSSVAAFYAYFSTR
ncbi:hypothetical protein THARTR1_05356 [Trichoderma harzianum]|uniref:Uncharacterized protein n=1 Tax=Trichoderma harzianum TaxID=5544 RepID=A0A2K0U8P8_TRIHA|nr:hypothetical protein THARTR1_05356 [Trichoderma harzianum]